MPKGTGRIITLSNLSRISIRIRCKERFCKFRVLIKQQREENNLSHRNTTRRVIPITSPVYKRQMFRPKQPYHQRPFTDERTRQMRPTMLVNLHPSKRYCMNPTSRGGNSETYYRNIQN